MQKNIANKKLKESKDSKSNNKQQEEEDMQLNIVGDVTRSKKEEAESDSDSEEEDRKNVKSDSLNTLHESEHQDIFDSEATFKSIGVSFSF
jgi:hypothetical protein